MQRSVIGAGLADLGAGQHQRIVRWLSVFAAGLQAMLRRLAQARRVTHLAGFDTGLHILAHLVVHGFLPIQNAGLRSVSPV